MKKSERIESLLAPSGGTPGTADDPRYLGFFESFNAQRYYEAHDVLEHLWLRTHDVDRDFFKGLIQIAGAFVHLQKQFLRPHHAKDGRRLNPAARLFKIGSANLARYRPHHLRLDVDAVCGMCERLTSEIAGSDFSVNPWQPDDAPKIFLAGA